MMRTLHTAGGLGAGLLLLVIALSGAILATEPVVDRLRTPGRDAAALSVAVLAERAAAARPAVERLERTPSGGFVVHSARGSETVAERLDPVAGRIVAAVEPSTLMQFVTRLHRSLLLDKAGRAAAGLAALALVALSISGALLMVRRLGGWRALVRPMRGTGSGRWHSELARLALVGLLLSGMTGCYLSLVSFDVLGDGSVEESEGVAAGTTGKRLPVGRLAALRGIGADSLRELTFPRRDDPADMYRVVTADGSGRIDPATGAVTAYQPSSPARRIHETVYMLHTGQGVWPLAMLLGLSALAVPVLAATGGVIWWRRRRRPRTASNASARSADTIILVGSEGGTTWQFAATLHRALDAAGFKVHTAAMNHGMAAFPSAARILVLAATCGDGAAPESARQFLVRLGRKHTAIPVAVLGFGDRTFPKFCKYAVDVAQSLRTAGSPELLPLACIDRQSAGDFKRWGTALGSRLGVPLDLDHRAASAETLPLVLVERIDYGEEVQAPTAILRFAMSSGRASAGRRRGWWRKGPALPGFQAGDLVGIVPPGGHAPRTYSLASSAADGLLEICVRKQPGGVCSGYLHALEPGAAIDAYIRPNPNFRLARGRGPVVLIGAGAGIAPLVGLIRANARRRPMHLYWGGRHPGSDFLYEGELSYYLSDRRLTRCRTAFSRIPLGCHVQDRLAREAGIVRELVRGGAQIVICGSRQMGNGVAATIDHIVRPLGLDLQQLKAQGRYVEDVY